MWVTVLHPAECAGLARWWIVFFAPSEAEFSTPILREHFALPGPRADETGGKPRARIASIGPTTGDFLRDAAGKYIPTLGTEGVLTAYYGNPRQVFASFNVKF